MIDFKPEAFRDEVEAVFRTSGDSALFVTISGAHLYGFPSTDSDVDFRGVHLAPIERVVALRPNSETLERMEGVVDLVSHEVRKFFTLLTKKNGYVLEHIWSPLVVYDSGILPRLREISKRLITRHHYHHYLGFARNQSRLYEKQEPQTAKSMLYILRVLMTGIHLLRTGRVEAKVREKEALPSTLKEEGAKTADRLFGELDRAFEATSLPDRPVVGPLEELLIELRRGQAWSEG